MVNDNENELENEIDHKDRKRPWPKHGDKYTKYKMCSSVMVVICIKQHLSNI